MSDVLNVFGLRLSAMSEAEAAAQEEKEKQEELAKRQARLLEHYRSAASGVPERYLHESLESFKPETPELEAALQKVRLFSKSRGGHTLILCGTNGTGKTHLGCGIIRERGGVYRSMLRLMYEVDGTMSFKAKESKVQFLDRLCHAPMLVLDELGRCGVREDMQKELVSYLVGERYAAGKPTVLITNFEKAELVNWLGSAINDRLNETGELIQLGGQSYRLKKRAELCPDRP